MHQHEIDVGVLLSREQLLERLVQGSGRCSLVEAAGDLGDDKELLASDSRLGDCPGDAVLVTVTERGVDVCAP